MNKYILVAGCTGVGKSLVSKFLCKIFTNHVMYSDPYVNNPFISSAYSDGTKSFQSQVFFFKEFLKIHKLINDMTDRTVIQERSIFESVEIFCKIFLYQKKIDINEYNIMKELLDELDGWIKIPNVIIYLKADKKIIRNRIKLRNRDFEKGIDEKFIQLQESFYIEWLERFCTEHSDIKLLEIDNSQINISKTCQMVFNCLKNL